MMLFNVPVPTLRFYGKILRMAALLMAGIGLLHAELPVVEGRSLVGIVDESDILSAVEGHEAGRADRFAQPVQTAMTRRLHPLEAHAPLSVLNQSRCSWTTSQASR